MAVRIAPSLLAADLSRLADAAAACEAAGADWLHLDVMDGHFVPNLTFGPPVIAALREKSRLPLDCHLMIANAERYLGDYARAGADIITVHAEACTHLHRALGQIKDLGKQAGVALNPATPLTAIEHVLDLCDLVLVMTVNPGFAGQRFIDLTAKVAALARLLQARGLGALVEVDGGIGPANAGLVARAGATVLVAGSALFGAPDLAGAIAALRAAAGGGSPGRAGAAGHG